LRRAYRDIVAAVAVTAVGMSVAGAETHTVILVAGGVGVIATEAAYRLFGQRGGNSDGPDDGPDDAAPPAAVDA
jgi:hypothetical protein